MSASLAGTVSHSAVPPTVGFEQHSLRVLTLTPFFPSAEDDSSGSFVAEPLTWTARFGIENQVIAVRPFYRSRIHAADCGISSQWKGYFSVPGNLGLGLAGDFVTSSISRIVQRMHHVSQFDLIHAHGALPCGHAAKSLSRTLSIPFVVSVHGLDAYSDRQVSGMMGRQCRRISENVYRSAKAVICVSEKVRQQITGATTNSVVVYNAVDADFFSPEGGPIAAPVILSVGNLIPTKGHAQLIRAFAGVAPHVPKSVLEIIGDGSQRENLVALAEELGLASRIFFRGRQSRTKTAEAMRRCTVFALPSSYEALGCVYLEAMACGKPVIGCEGQGISEIIENGKNGFLSSSANEAELGNLLLMLLESESHRRRVGARARETILQSHTLQHQAAQLARVYQECVA
jgi:teichuronic acid biosynthesis glycosyltransferase TuaC